MIFFWRGWGILALAYFVATGIFGIAIPYNLLGPSGKWLMIPIGLLFGVMCWVHGRYLNITKPADALKDFELYREQVMESVRAGTFRLPDQPPPTSLGQATGQAEAYLQLAHTAVTNGRNRHTFFFIPFQYFGILIALWSVLLPVLSK